MPTKEEVFEKIQAALVDALGVDDEDVTPEATLVETSAPSRSTSWTSFSASRSRSPSRFRAASCSPRISSPTPSTSRTARSPKRLGRAAQTDAVANLDDFAKNPVVQDFGNLLTVADMCRFVEGKVEVTD